MNKTIIGLIIAGILLVSIPVGVRLVQQQQILKSRAAEGALLCSNDPAAAAQGGAGFAPPCPEPAESYYWDDNAKYLNADTGECLGGPMRKCVRKYGCTVWESDNKAHWVYAEANPTKCGEGVPTPTPGGGNCLDSTPAPSGSPSNCPGVSWATIWAEMKNAGYGWGVNDKCDSATVLAKFLSLGNNASRCSAGGGGACNLGNQSPSVGNLLSCILSRNPGLVNGIKTAMDPNNPSRFNSCSDLQLVNFWCNDGFGVGSDASKQCAADKAACAAGGVPAGVGLSCNVTVSSPVVRGGDVQYDATTLNKAIGRTLELTYNYGQWENTIDWKSIKTCPTTSSQPCSGTFNTSSVPADKSRIWVKCDVRPEDTNVAISASNACSGNPLLGDIVGGRNGLADNIFPGWVSCGKDSHKEVTLTAAAAVTPIPTSTPTPSPAVSCNAQARLSKDGNPPWDLPKTITLGEPIYIAGFDGDQTETASADITDIQIKGPSDSPKGVSPHTVTLDSTKKDEKNIFSYTVPPQDGPGKYTITARKNGVNCSGTATLTVTAPASTTAYYRVSENKDDLVQDPSPNTLIQWKTYTGPDMLDNYTFRDTTPGQKFLYIEFKRPDNTRGGCDSSYGNPGSEITKTFPCRIPIKFIASASISRCDIIYEDSTPVLNLTGTNLGTSGSAMGTTIYGASAGTNLSVRLWGDTNISLTWPGAPKGVPLYIILKTALGQTLTASCASAYRPSISGCALSFEGSTTILNLTGTNFGEKSGTAQGTTDAVATSGKALDVKSWGNTAASLAWSNAPLGKTLNVIMTTISGDKASAACSSTSQLALSSKVFCQQIGSCDRKDADLVLQDAKTGDIIADQKVTIGADGVVKGLNQKLISDHQYILSLKAPNSLRRNRTFTSSKIGGTTNLDTFVLPIGDIAHGGDGKIAVSDYSQMVRDWNISGDASGRISDLDCNGRCNSRDWACLRYDYGKEDDPTLIPGVILTPPSVTPSPGATGTPAPGVTVTPTPTACTLGMYVRFEDMSNAEAPPQVTLALFPQTSTVIGPNTPCLANQGCQLLTSGVSVTPSTNPNIMPFDKAFLITSGTNQLACGTTYNVVVAATIAGATGYKPSRFDGVPVVSDPIQYPAKTFENQQICRALASGCNNNCLDNDPCCPYNADVGRLGRCRY